MASSSLPTATAVPACEGEGKSEPTVLLLSREPVALDERDEAQEVKHEREEAYSLLLRPPHEQVRRKTKLLKTINWTNDRYELSIEKRAEEQAGHLFVVFIICETSSGKKFASSISDKEQASLHLHEGAPLGLCGMESLCQFMEDAFVLQKPGVSCSLPEFLESSVSSVSLTISYDNGMSGYAAVRFQVQVDLALFHKPSEVEVTRMVMEKKVGALQDQVTEEARALREEVSSLREMVQQLEAQLQRERAAASTELSTLRGQVQEFQQLSGRMIILIGRRTNGMVGKELCEYIRGMEKLENLKTIR